MARVLIRVESIYELRFEEDAPINKLIEELKKIKEGDSVDDIRLNELDSFLYDEFDWTMAKVTSRKKDEEPVVKFFYNDRLMYEA